MMFTYYASDVLIGAMELALSKAINSYSFRDCKNWLNALWHTTYERVAKIDAGFYSETVQLTQRMTQLPPCVKSTVKIYASQAIVDAPRRVYRSSSMSDLMMPGTYHVSGNDLYCPDAESRIIWLNYVPEPPMISFTKNNRDPRILDAAPPVPPVANMRYGGYVLSVTPQNHYLMTSMYDSTIVIDITSNLIPDGHTVEALILDYPYIFVSYRETVTGDISSFILKDILREPTSIRFNPFDYQGRPSQVKYLTAKWNDETGMGVVIQDMADGRIKELGWTPDTVMTYPSPIVYDYMVAHLAEMFADMNEADVRAVSKQLIRTEQRMSDFMAVDQASWQRLDRVVGPTLGDLL